MGGKEQTQKGRTRRKRQKLTKRMLCKWKNWIRERSRGRDGRDVDKEVLVLKRSG